MGSEEGREEAGGEEFAEGVEDEPRAEGVECVGGGWIAGVRPRISVGTIGIVIGGVGAEAVTRYYWTFCYFFAKKMDTQSDIKFSVGGTRSKKICPRCLKQVICKLL